MTKQNTQFLFFIPERRLSYEKIVQMSEKASSLLECFSECSLSYAKIVQMSEKASSLLECFSECSLSYEKRDLYNVISVPLKF